jgi:tripartite-type tricarboxylate transporter receptor subunit TctC
MMDKRVTNCARTAAGAMFAVLAVSAALRAEYPDQPIKAVVPFAAGGYVDGFARIFTDRLGALLGKAVIVENKPGAGGKIGDDYVAASRPDGLTLLIDDVTRPVLSTLTNPDVAPNEMLENFALAGMLGSSPIILTAAATLGVKDFASLIAKVKAAPGKYSYGTPGPGTPSHVVSAQIVRLFRLDVVHVPYRGGAATLADVAGGTLAWMVNTPNSALPLIDAGKVVPLFVIGRKRLKQLHDVPTLEEIGYPQFTDEIGTIFLMAPAATPAPILDRLNEATNRVQKDPEVIARLDALALVAPPPDISRAAIRALAAGQIAAWTRAVSMAAGR